MVTSRKKVYEKSINTTKLEVYSKTENEIKSQQKSRLSIENVVFISLLLDLLAFTMILPLFPSILEYYKSIDPPDRLYLYLQNKLLYFGELVGVPSVFNSVLFGGFLGSLFSFLQFVASPIVGALSDVYGRKPIILMCLIGIAFSYWLWSIAYSLTIFVIARIVGGISKGNLSLSMAVMTDVSTPKNRTYGMALIGISFSIGFVIGPMIGAYYARFSKNSGECWFVNAAMFAFSLIVTDIIFVIFFFPETLPKEKRSKSVAHSLRDAVAYISITDLFKFKAVRGMSKKEVKELRTLGLVYFIYLFLYSGLEFTLTFLTHYKFKYTSMQQGWMFFCIGITMAILQGGWVRRIPPETVQKYITFGLLLIVPSFLCVGLAQSIPLLAIGLFLFSVSTSIVVPCMTSIASKYGSVSQKGRVLGIFRSLGALARAIGPVVASTAYWMVGSTMTYCLGGVLLLYPWYILKQSPAMKK